MVSLVALAVRSGHGAVKRDLACGPCKLPRHQTSGFTNLNSWAPAWPAETGRLRSEAGPA